MTKNNLFNPLEHEALISTPKSHDEKYYVVTTAIKTGESENKILHLIKSCDFNLSHSEAEVAQAIYSGRFDKETYGQPCFDFDGSITWPESNKEINKSQFDMLSEFLDVYPVEDNIEEHEDDIKMFVSARI